MYYPSVMKLYQPFLFVVLFFPFTLLAGDPPVDISKADADGPHIFYRGEGIVVKQVERLDTSVVVRTQSYSDRSIIRVQCRIPERGYAFSFSLQKNLTVAADNFPLPARMLVLSDIEGNFDALYTMLIGAKVIDPSFNWTFGDGHLVLLGDFFDRGLNVTECLWLIYKLETEALEAGGRVHFVLGNHEVLNLEGRFDYVRNKYIENAALIGIDYKYWYDNNSELGRWLRTKHSVLKIGDYVFCHGGISPELVASGVPFFEINRIGRQYLGKKLESIPTASGKTLFSNQTGIYWSRAAARQKLDEKAVEDILRYAGAKRMVIGHTLMADVTSLYGGKVICTDLFHEDNLRMGFMKTLWIEDGIPYGLDSRGEKNSLGVLQQIGRK